MSNTSNLPPFYNFSPNLIKVVNIIATGRTSAVFYQGLFDRHPQVIILPFHCYVKFNKDIDEIVKDVFETALNNIFGVPLKKNIISKLQFRKYFVEYLNEFGISRKNIFLATHYAYARIRYKTIEHITTILYQTHAIYNSVPFYEDFPESKLILTVRDPRAMYYSLKKQPNPILYPPILIRLSLIYWCVHVFAPKKLLIVRHEDIHLNSSLIMKKSCKFMEISDNNDVTYCSFYGKPYTGESYGWKSSSGFFSAQPNKKYVTDTWKDELSVWELRLINFFFKKYIRDNKYPKFEKNNTTKKMFSKQLHEIVDKNVYYTGKNKIKILYLSILKIIARIPLISESLLKLIALTQLSYVSIVHLIQMTYLKFHLFIILKMNNK